MQSRASEAATCWAIFPVRPIIDQRSRIIEMTRDHAESPRERSLHALHQACQSFAIRLSTVRVVVLLLGSARMRLGDSSRGPRGR